jgi:subtilase family serine protease
VSEKSPMLTKICSFACATAVIVLVGSPVNSQLPSNDRIQRPVDVSRAVAVKGTAHPLAHPQFDQGRVSSVQPINGALVFRLSPAQQSDLDHLLRDQQNPSSPSYHHWLTPEQYADRYGMTPNDLAKVKTWLKSQGLGVGEVSRGRNEIHFSGPAIQVERAFRTQIHRYLVQGQDHFANASAISVPQAFSDVVLAVRGLDDFRPKPMLRTRTMSSPNPRFTSSLSGSHFLDPKDFAVIYNVNPLYTAGFDGTGIKIAVTGQTQLTSGGNANTDLDAFRAAAGLRAKDPTFVPVGPTPNFDSGAALEADLDLEWSNAVAPNADVIFVYAADAFEALTDIVDNNRAPIVSNSFGLCEADLGSSSEQALWQTIRQGNAQGQTVTTASGDNGAADCDGDKANTPTSATLGLTVDVPAAIPEVTGVGGTEFMGDAAATVTGTAPNTCAGATQFWDASPGTPPTCDLTSSVATAKSYIPEMAWNDTQASIAAGFGFASGGGGTSIFFAKPSWQTGTGVPADGARDVPDVALNASPDHDPYLICSAGACVNGFRNPNDPQVPNSLDAIGGTSAGAPTFAGILALILQATGGAGLGNVNPMLYSLSESSPGAFHDITSGNNKVPCSSGTPNCTAGTTMIGFSAGQGYDQATGLGSVDASALETAWLAAIASAPADFVMDGLSSTVATPGAQGSATLNVTASNGFADTVNLTCSPSSQSAQISCSLNPASLTLTGTNTVPSTLSITTVASLERPRLPRSRGVWFAATGGGLFAAVILGGIPSRRRWMGLLSLVLLATAIGAVGCGGGGGGTPQQKAQGTPKGNYVITVTATGQNTGKAHSLNVSLIVQ